MAIKYIKTKDLTPHIINEKIYQDDYDNDFVESIKNKGILTAIIITKDNVIISGHRRHSVALEINLETVPVVVSDLTDELDIEEAVIEANRQRSKNNEQKAREFLHLKNIEEKRAKQRMSEGGQGGIKNEGVENLPQVDGKSRDIAASKIGMSGRSAEQAAEVVNVIDAMEDIGNDKKAGELKEKLNKSVNSAFKEIKPIIEEKKKQIKDVENSKPHIEELENNIFIVNSQNPKYKATFNATNDSIEWAKWTWNPVTGCNHDCKYCYARKMACNPYYKDAFPTKFTPTLHPSRLNAPQNTNIPESRQDEHGINNVFVCSMADLFGDWVPKEWIDQVLESCKKTQKWNFLFLTKNPKKYIGIEWPENSWVGTTVDNKERMIKAKEIFSKFKAPVKFLSCEPLLEDVEPGNDLSMFDWIIIGGLKNSENTDKQPKWEWVEKLYSNAKKSGCKIYFKPNLTVRPKEYPIINSDKNKTKNLF